MAETLTYDPGTDSTTLTTDEQESLEVGEKLVAEQEGLLAGKYKNAEELEQGYLELQKKFGTEETETKEEVTQTEEPVEEVSSQVTLINDASAEYAEKGELSQETLAKFSEMSSKDLVEAYMEISKNSPQQQSQVVDLTDSEVIKRLAAAQGIDVLNLVKTPEQLQQEMEAQQQAANMQSLTDQMGQLAGTPLMDPSKNQGLADQLQTPEETPPPEE